MTRLVTATVCLGLLIAPRVACGQQLKIGSAAPPLDIEHWISLGSGLTEPVTHLEPGRVYVIEFWATWCGPCLASMPHLAQLQRDYADRGVSIISVSDEELEVVKAFLARPVPAGIARTLQPAVAPPAEADSDASVEAAAPSDTRLTFGQLTSAYALTTDPDQSVSRAYLEASGEAGIPTAFIVGKQGHIEWIGHPMEIDQPLAEVVADRWDRQKYVQQRDEKRAFEEAVQRIYQLLRENEIKPALEKLDELLTKAEGSEMQFGLQLFKLELLIHLQPAQAVAVYEQIADKTETADSLNVLVWKIVQIAEHDSSAISAELLGAARKSIDRAVQLAPDSPSVLDTLAHLAYLQGELDLAIEVQTRAVQIDPQDQQLKDFLERLRKEKSEG